MAQVAISLAIAGATTAAQLLLAPKPKKPAPIDRGKLDDARFSIPALGAAIPKGWGTFRCAPIWIDHTPTLHTVEVTEGQSGGKGAGGTPPTPDERKHIYTKSVIGVFHNGLIHKGVSKMWFGEKLVYNADLARNEVDTSATRYEAELGILAGGATVTAQSECSGGMKVTGLGSGGNVTLNVDVDSAGSYEIAAFYTSTVDRTFKVSVNGGSLNDLFCPASGGAGEVTSEVIVLTLSSGANTIKFENAGAACPDLDRIDITPELIFTPEGEDPRGFTGITRPGRFGPDDPDYAWPVANEAPLFSETAGGVTNGGFYQAVLSEWGNPTIRFYNGSELQEPDPITIALRGLSNSPAYRGYGIIAIENIQLQNGQMPNVTLEVQEGTRELPAIVNDLYKEVNVAATEIDVSALSGLLLGDASGFDPGTYSAITWTGLSNATQTGSGAITKTSGTNNTWNAYANSGDSVSNGSDASIRFTAGAAGTYMLGFAYTTTPGSALPHPYDQVPFAVVLNKKSNPSQEDKNAIQLSLGQFNNSFDVGVWSPGDKFQVEYRNGRFAAYQNGLMLTGYIPPVPSTFPLRPIFMGYATGGGPSAASFATGSNIGTEPIIANGGGLFMESPGPAADMLAALMLRFQFSMPEVDGKPKAVLNNASSDLTIPYTDLRAHRGDDMPKEDMVISRVDPLKLAKVTTVYYSDPAYSYHTRPQSEPRLFGPMQGKKEYTLPLIETAQNMKNLAIILSNREEVEGQTYRFTLGPKYHRIHQGTQLTINSRSGVTHRVRVTEIPGMELPAGLIEVEGVRQDASVFSANGTPADISIESPVVAVPGNTKGVIIDGPLLRAEDAGDGTQPVVYVAMSGRGSGTWPGGFLYKEFPLNSGNYTLVTASDRQAGVGVTSGTLPAVSDPSIWDRTSELIVGFYSTTELESVTEAEVLANAELNLLGIINPTTGEVEYVQFTTATPLTIFPTLPEDAPGLIRGYSSRNIVGLSDGAPVASVPDASTVNDPAVQSTGTNQPSYQTNEQNGQPTILLDGSNDYLSFTEVTDIWTVYVVLKHNTGSQDLAAFLGSSATDFNFHGGEGNKLFDPSSAHADLRNGSAWVNGYAETPINILKSTSVRVFTFRSVGALRANVIGSDRLTAGRYWNGPLYELWLYNASHSNEMIQSVVEGFKQVYGLTETAVLAPLVVLDGNSLMSNSLQVRITNCLAGNCASGTPLISDWIVQNFGVSGQTTPQMLADFSTQVAPLYNANRTKNIYVMWEATNHHYLDSGVDANEAFASLMALCDAAQTVGFDVVIPNVLPRSNAGTPADFETWRTAVNSLINSNAGAEGYLVANVAGNSTIGDAGDETNTTYYSDLVHLTDAGNDIVAPLIATQITAY